ncbi:MAG: hypothetical protein HYZ42_09865 [Bacteroidetes bacterium]|nr:hypothetical protein [Bacteroidota bacterium]
MKNRIYISLMLILLAGCYTPSYLPKPENLVNDTHGGYVVIKEGWFYSTAGELLAIDSIKMIILTDSNMEEKSEILEIPFSKMSSFKLRYARNMKAGWTVPVYVLSTLSHGFFFIISAPVNALTAGIISDAAKNQYLLKSSSVTYKDLQKYARFPQGIPPNISWHISHPNILLFSLAANSLGISSLNSIVK